MLNPHLEILVHTRVPLFVSKGGIQQTTTLHPKISLPERTPPHTQSAPWASHHANGREGPWRHSLAYTPSGCYTM